MACTDLNILAKLIFKAFLICLRILKCRKFLFFISDIDITVKPICKLIDVQYLKLAYLSKQDTSYLLQSERKLA